MDKNTFDSAHKQILSMMEKESMPGYLKSRAHRDLNKRIKNGDMDRMVQEDIESVKDFMSKEVFLP